MTTDTQHSMSSDIKSPDIERAPSPEQGYCEKVTEQTEVFNDTEDGVKYRTVGWIKASVIFIKILFAVGVLSIPTAMYTLGAVGGSLNVVGWGAFNTYVAVVLGNFRLRHRGCHSVADMAEVVGGKVTKEIVGLLFIIAYVLSAGAVIVGISVGLNTLSHHAACTVWWAFLAAAVVASVASIRKLNQLGWLTYIGCGSIFVAVLTVVIAVTQRDRPAAAPQTGDYEFGFNAIAYPSFTAGVVATCTIFYSSSATSAFLPVMAEMKRPEDYRKSLYLCMGFVTSSYLCFSLVVYRWCGKWVASPSLGSAGQTIKMVAYGIGLLGLVISASVYMHLAAKYIFVRLLRDTRHLQQNTVTHWVTWLTCTFGLALISFVCAEAIPIFNYLNALAGSLCFAPLSMVLPAWLWLYDHSSFRTGTAIQRLMYWAHVFLIPFGFFFIVGGTYGVGLQIRDAYAYGTIKPAFSCADNSNYGG
ncbi:hypothetical protein PENCOP_c004G07635 [Penicillium coprophilum]|uniref:Amino acid transporter transmembrane domain-containing protein n=1 Tax=Penicillium coprophilum TaxID=36646 RepID=A0A1V6UVM8_9EURO|nr:hypothetical protein PENCOP_c004G07635 [Penicillium coprophilum]